MNDSLLFQKTSTSESTEQRRTGEQEYARRRYRENRALYREYCRKYCYAHRRERYCHLLVYLAIKSGKLTRQPCEICGKLPADAHHDDYSEPLTIRWLCRRHHRLTHKGACA